MLYVILALFSAAIVGLDQWTKYLTVAADKAGNLPSTSFLGIFHITYAENTGGAWSMFQGQTWLFIAVMVLFIAAIVVLIWKKWLTAKLEWWCLAAILGGGIGNMIDRLSCGYVRDMICFDFVEFPIFNVADCFITVGCFVLLIYVLFFERRRTAEHKQPDEQK